jgi:hypothetical protein
LTNRGFVELHNPTGFFIVGIGFLLVMLIVAAGGIFSRMLERDNVERRQRMREAQQAKAREETDANDSPTETDRVDNE